MDENIIPVGRRSRIVAIKNARSQSIMLFVLLTLTAFIATPADGSGKQPTAVPDFQVTATTLARDVDSSEKRQKPVRPGIMFSTSDERVVSFLEYRNLKKPHDFRWEWIDPSGITYMDTGNYTIRPPRGQYIQSGATWHHIHIQGEKAMTMPGRWQVKIYMNDQLIANQAFTLSESGTSIGMPPMLAVEEIAFSKTYLEGGGNGELEVTIRNTGYGEAKDVVLIVNSDTPELIFDNRQRLPVIAAGGGRVTFPIPVQATKDISTGTATVDIQVVEPHFRVTIQGKRMVVPTRAFRNPVLQVVQFAAVESQSAQANNQIDINEVIDVRFAIQNTGQGEARDVTITVNNNQAGVLFLGQGEGLHLSQNRTRHIPTLRPGEYEIVNHRFFVNSDFTGQELAFHVFVDEHHRRYGAEEIRTVAINTNLAPEGYIRDVEVAGDYRPEAIVIQNIPDFFADAELEIPVTNMSRPEAIAVVIGNGNYLHNDIPVVRFAHRDATAMKSWLTKTLGFDERNIIFLKDITKANFEAVFGIRDNPHGRLADYVRPGRSDVFVYYSGHGAPDPNDRKGYFLPVDSDPNRIALNGYSLNLFYENLSKIEARSVTVVLEACFSGGTSTGEMIIRSASPVMIEINQPDTSGSNTTVLASSEYNQISSWYNEKNHGLFTWFFLKGLSGKADLNGDGKITLAEMHEYLSSRTDGVPYWARRLHGREQRPVLFGAMPDMVLVTY